MHLHDKIVLIFQKMDLDLKSFTIVTFCQQLKLVYRTYIRIIRIVD